ncbi:MAG: permease [Thermovirgaceae bacterium]|nr:permease [Synergistales bacterium]
MNGKRSSLPFWAVLFLAFAAFVALSALIRFAPGIKCGTDFLAFARTMAGLLPPTFLLVGLFHSWVKRETVEKHMGSESGVQGYFWAIVLAGTIVGGLFVALPLCLVLQKKGASMKVILTFLNASMICRIPMTVFEASFLGIGFTIVRYAVSIPLLILIAWAMTSWLGEDFRIAEP